MKISVKPANTGALFLTLGIIVLFFISLLAGCSGKTTVPISSSELLQSQNEVARTSLLFAYWQKQNPGFQWAALAQGDFNTDGRDDLIIIYSETASKCSMVLVLNFTSRFQITDSVPAPLEDQVIRLTNLDDTPPNEFMVSGRKGDNVGSALFRLEDGKIVMIFTTEYGDCC